MDHFIDEVRMQLEAGKGGNGCVAFRREKYIPFGGPSGGDGGDGGSVYIQGDRSIQTLARFKESFYYKGKKGTNGAGKGLYGKKGEDLYLKVPIGTVVYEEVTGQIIADITNNEDIICLAQGGKGGKGNIHFKTSTNKAPEIAEKGSEGQVKRVKMELKILADVGLVGFPNAGKSTFITSVSNSSSQVAAYAFSTLRPYLGTVKVGEWESFIMADIPGIIEGSSEGKGKGLKFLKHIERSKIYIFVIDLFTEDPSEVFHILREELSSYNLQLLKRPYLVALNKIDGFPPEELVEIKQEFLDKTGLSADIVFMTSTLKKEGLSELIEKTFELVENIKDYQEPLVKQEHIDLLEKGWSENPVELENLVVEEETDIEIFWENSAGEIISDKHNKKR